MAELPQSYADYVAQAKSLGGKVGFPDAMIFPKDYPPVMRLADNQIDTVIDVAATIALYWGCDDLG